MSKITDVLVGVLYFAVIALLIALILGAPVMLLWNAVMPAIFDLTKISFGQAIVLNLLASVLFGRINVGGKE